MGNYSLLIVDDESLTLDLLRNAIQWDTLGIEHVMTAKNIKTAKEKFGERRIDVMLCDIEMPGGSGLELLRWVRENGYTTEDIFLTSHAEFKYAQEAIELGCMNYLLKPVFFDELKKVVAKALAQAEKKRSQTDEAREAEAQETAEEEKPVTEKVREYIEAHYMEDISCQSIAQQHFISQEHLSRSFKQKYGISPSSYIQNCRLHEAKHLLATSSLSISQVAIRAGYSNYAYFSSVFKQATGMSPLEYRNNKARISLV